MASRAKLPERISFKKACQKRFERAEIKRRETLSKPLRAMSLQIVKSLQKSLGDKMNSLAAKTS